MWWRKWSLFCAFPVVPWVLACLSYLTHSLTVSFLLADKPALSVSLMVSVYCNWDTLRRAPSLSLSLTSFSQCVLAICSVHTCCSIPFLSCCLFLSFPPNFPYLSSCFLYLPSYFFSQQAYYHSNIGNVLPDTHRQTHTKRESNYGSTLVIGLTVMRTEIYVVVTSGGKVWK